MGYYSSETAASLAATASGQLGALIAGKSVAKNDVVVVGPHGKSKKVDVIDYAAIADVGQIVAQTQVAANRIAIGKNCGLRLSDGSLMIIAPYIGQSGCSAYRYAPDGRLIYARGVDGSTQNLVNPHMIEMPNGNIALVYGLYDSSTGLLTLRRVIFVNASYISLSENIGSMQPPGALTQYNQNVNFFGTVALPQSAGLPGGGFAVVYPERADSTVTPAENVKQKIAVYEAAGNQIVAPTTVFTWTGLPGIVYTDAVALSNGNIAIVCYARGGTADGTYFAVFDAAGHAVKTFTQIAAASTTLQTPEISAMAGYFAIARINDGTECKLFVFDNAGNQQGATYTTPYASGGARMKLLNDGAAFFLIGANFNDPNYTVSRVPTTGGIDAVMHNTGLTMTRMVAFDAKYDGEFIVIFQAVGDGGKNQFAAIDVATGVSLAPFADVGVAPAGGSNNGTGPQIVFGGDYAFAGIYDYTTAAGIHFCITKYAPSAIVGVAQTAAAAGEEFTLSTGQGVYKSTPNIGSAAKHFDHSGGVVAGNKGSIQQNSLVIKGG